MQTLGKVPLLLFAALVAASCRFSTGPDCQNPFTGSVDGSGISDARLSGCARFYQELGTNRWIIELREDGDVGEWINVIYSSTRPAVGNFAIPNTAFTTTISFRTLSQHRTFVGNAGSLVISDASARVRGTLAFSGHEDTRGSSGSATVSVNVKFTATCKASQFESC
jgi:hypothetical protein